MENLIISMEATCDLPKEIVEKYNFKIVSYWLLFVEQKTKCAFEGNSLKYTNEKSPCSSKVLPLPKG